jgi:hypothetical protein
LSPPSRLLAALVAALLLPSLRAGAAPRHEEPSLELLSDAESGAAALAPPGWELFVGSKRDSLAVRLNADKRPGYVNEVALLQISFATGMSYAPSAKPSDIVRDLVKHAHAKHAGGWLCAERRDEAHAVCARKRHGAVLVASFQGKAPLYRKLGGLAFVRRVADSVTGIAPR